MAPLELLRELTSLVGPPGQEQAVREGLAAHVAKLGFTHRTDAKGNLLVSFGSGKPRIVVTAHLDEIAMIVREILPDGTVKVGPLGGLHPWKLGEGPVQLLADRGPLDAVLGFGSIHTDDPNSTARKAGNGGLSWDMARLFTGRTQFELRHSGVRPGTRVVVHPCRRALFEMDDFVSGYFLDDRSDLVAWLLAMPLLKGDCSGVLFAATTSEEVGGEGAKYILQEYRPEVCIALELAPRVADAPIALSDQPVVWVTDSYSTMQATDGELVQRVGREINQRVQFQALSRGGSDASASAALGLCARPITLGIPMENSHGYEVMHRRAMDELARLTAALVQHLVSEG